jgi:hypothetical protein
MKQIFAIYILNQINFVAYIQRCGELFAPLLLMIDGFNNGNITMTGSS